MAKINLLPWREELRKEKQRQFLSILSLVFVLGAVGVFAYLHLLGQKIDSQRERNNYLAKEIKAIERQIKEIEKLEKEREQLIERMEMIARLQRSRPQVVHIFDELVRSIPEGLNLKNISREGATLKFEGVAESSQRVTAFMRNITDSKWFLKPVLKDITTDSDFGASRKLFLLVTKEASAEEDEDAAPAEGE
ncbi:PilN domain-containing protein [Pleionea sp. CnH1-48]|uniref:PilN domain-containing protein n=1 Tax=Pleionea sp. CnH1-48 TaxID=2954494 RepID=UPI0020981173|nr:PilN domain-containing protein [Pleionea sp. CnH1-48]MCO7224479.1 PilN domain-containing protein [Pleionea sp. CnH1-48]